jgi:two-component system sensor histidine kinase CpxA
MRSLFAKILLWFIATVVITSVGFSVATALTFAGSREKQPVSRLLPFALEEARYSYENGGSQRLKLFLDRFDAIFQARGILTDAQGRDLATGELRPDLFANARRRVGFMRGNSAVIPRMADDGRYCFFMTFPRRNAILWLFLPQHVWVVGIIMLFCWAFAAYLTSPLRRLEKAVERFGKGDFAARSDLNRRDEFGRLAKAFNQMAERIQSLLASERRLLLDISHELRSPLARLGVAVELARTGEDRESALNRIQKESDRLNALVGELLQVTRAEGDPKSLRSEKVRLDQLLQTVVDDCSIEAAPAGCTLDLRAPQPATVQGDPELLRRAMENVLRNAIRHAPRGSAVEVSLAATPERAVIAVRDYGPGVPPSSLPHIFEPFYRVETDRGRGTGGVGLGLSITRRAVELHSGQLRARNAEPGLLVEIDFPVAAQNS